MKTQNGRPCEMALLGLRPRSLLGGAFLAALLAPLAAAGEPGGAERYRRDVLPILEKRCFDCHGEGSHKGNMALDEFRSDEELLESRTLWWNVLKNLHAGVMPPRPRSRPSTAEKTVIRDWVKADVFDIDPRDPDPGRVTLRRLNRVEYRNTIRDLMGIDFDTALEFPPDDTGYGFDTIGDVLSISPLLLEKYLEAAESIVERAVPRVPYIVHERRLSGYDFRRPEGQESGPGSGDRMTFYQVGRVEHALETDRAGVYSLELELHVDGNFEYDPGRCRVTFTVDGTELLREEYVWEEGCSHRYELSDTWAAGDHHLAFALEPLSSGEQKQKLDFRVLSVRVRGPLAKKDWIRPPGHDRFFPGGGPPEEEAQRRKYRREILSSFTLRALRRPAEESFLNRLVSVAEGVEAQSGKTFEEGIARAISAVLASPRFLFRLEGVGPTLPGESHPLVDEYALASRLSYFLWSTMPDDELLALAGRGELRKNLPQQLERMLADPRSAALVENFTGQWLQARDVQHVSIDPIAALGFQKRWEELRAKVFRGGRRRRRRERTPEEQKLFAEFRRLADLRDTLNPALRRAMRKETEMCFEHVFREDRSVLELIDSDYTFLNQALAEHYGIPGVEGEEMRKVVLPEGSPRGGVLTQGTFLVVTSNPTRTSPVKRGLFILDNILGTPAPPPPEAVPELEESAKAFSDHEPTLREILEVHREKALCRSCHARFDPLGLALENFNALGMWREGENDRPIDPAGKLITGETFRDLRELKTILTGDKRPDFYRCLVERMLTFALGRGLDYYDVHTVDEIVARLEREDGRFSALLKGIVESAPFQKRRAETSGGDRKVPPTKGGRRGRIHAF